MVWTSDSGGTRWYAILAVFVLVIIMVAALFSGRQLTAAYVDDAVLVGGWGENILERVAEKRFFGLEQWVSFTYEIDGPYPASLTVTTMTTPVMMNEQELKNQMIDTIQQAANQGIIIDLTSEETGERILNNTHQTVYFRYGGNDTSKTPSEQIRIVGEAWNCGISGTSVICIGVAQVSDFAHNSTISNTERWETIVRDKNGLIFSVICH